MKQKSSIAEARRYLDNAEELLREKAVKEDCYYQNVKYVKMVGHTAYAGVLLTLDQYLGKKSKGGKDADWYKQKLSKLDKKILNSFLTAYQVLHLDSASDGAGSADLARSGMPEAEKLIGWMKVRTAA